MARCLFLFRKQKSNVMTSKKSNKANLEKKKSTFLQLGFIVAISFTLVAFEWLGSEHLGTGIESNLNAELAPETIIEVEVIKPKKKVIIPPKKTKTNTVVIVKKPIVVAGPVIIDPNAGNEPPIDWDVFDKGDPDEPIDIVAIDSVYIFVKEMPEFPGGLKAMYQFMGDNIKYPTMSAEAGSQGQAYVNFTIEKNGKITDVKILGGSADKRCKKEAARVVESMPKWKPGEQGGKRVRVSYTLPVRFVLD
jgi:protein TonB